MAFVVQDVAGNVSSRADYPAQDAYAVTPSDSAIQSFRALYIGNTGNVSVVTNGGTTVAFLNCPTGLILPICGQQVLLSGTTASSIVALV